MPPLGSIFRSGTNRPKVDQHSLFTSIQVSVPVLQGTLQVYEPWKKKRVKARPCHVTLYANDTSPFLVWSKAYNSANGKSPRSPTSRRTTGSASSPSSPEAPSCGKPRCVLPVSRAKVTKTTGGCFEVEDFSSSLMFRFVAPTIRESETWVEKLREESQREANLDMGSMCSSSSSYSSSSSHPSPGSNEYMNMSLPQTPTTFSRTGYQLTALNEISHANQKPASASNTANFEAELTCDDDYDASFRLERPSDLPVHDDVFGAYVLDSESDSSSRTFPRSQGIRQRHTRAQPHLGVNVHTVDKHRPDLGNLLRNPSQMSDHERQDRSALPLSEYFVNLPST